MIPPAPPAVRINKATLGLLKRVEPYIAWGYPNLKSVRELVYKRGFGKVNGQRVALTENEIIEANLGKHGVICMEDLIHQIYTGEGERGAVVCRREGHCALAVLGEPSDDQLSMAAPVLHHARTRHGPPHNSCFSNPPSGTAVSNAPTCPPSPAVGPAFKECSNFLWPFQLSSANGGLRKKRIHYIEGGDAGCREQKINELIQRMN